MYEQLVIRDFNGPTRSYTNKRGSQMDVYAVWLEGRPDPVEVHRKPGNPPRLGPVMARVDDDAPYSPRMYIDYSDQGSPQAHPPASHGQAAQHAAQPVETPQTALHGLSQHDERERRITRMHSQEMALRALAVMYANTMPLPESPEFWRQVKSATDWFDSDAKEGGR